jgi:hypothetical protein
MFPKLPLSQFWYFSLGLCIVTVVFFRGKRNRKSSICFAVVCVACIRFQFSIDFADKDNTIWKVRFDIDPSFSYNWGQQQTQILAGVVWYSVSSCATSVLLVRIIRRFCHFWILVMSGNPVCWGNHHCTVKWCSDYVHYSVNEELQFWKFWGSAYNFVQLSCLSLACL